MSIYVEGILIGAGINIVLALGYWLSANTNQFSLGHAAFMAVGAYTSSVATVRFGLPLPLGLVIAAASSGIVGVLAGFPGLRLSLLHLAMVTLAFAELMQIALSNLSYVGGLSGFAGMTGTTLPIVFVVVGITLLFVVLHSRSREGLAAIAVREDPEAARAAGINVTAVKVSAFGWSALFVGLGGALLAHHLLFIQPGMFGASQSILIILFVVFGGLYSYWGPILGAIVLTLLPDFVDFAQGWYLIFYGSLFIVLMIVRPAGLIGSPTKRSDSGLGQRVLAFGERLRGRAGGTA